MFTVNNHWETGKEQDVLNESLFGTVNLISYKKDEYSIKKEESSTKEVKNLKRKTSLKERGRKKKNCKYIINEKSNETCTKRSQDLNEKQVNKLSPVDVVTNANSLHLHSKAEKDCIDKEPQKKNKKKKKAKNIDEKVILEFKKPETQYNVDDKTLSNKVCSDDNDKEKEILSNHENDIELVKSKVDKTKGKKKKKAKKPDEIVTVEFNKSQTHINGDDKTSSNQVCSDDDHKEKPTSRNHENDTELTKSKVDKKKKKMKKRGTVEPVDPIEKSDNHENMKIITSNNDEVEENINDKNINCNIVLTEVDNNSPFIPPSKKFKSQDTSKYNKFQKKIVEKLKGGQFRWINEKLYSCKSSDAVNMFSSDPKMFEIYHKGFHSQVQQWPQNPVDVIIEYIKARDNKFVIADFGCGDAKLSSSVPNKVHSFDLVAVNEHVTACDMKKVPLSGNSVDIAVFCLSLMGTNLVDFLVEAHRVIKVEGILKIAEVKSRFDDTDKFNQDVSSLGFSLIEKDDSNKMFILLEFQKTEKIPSKKTTNITLNPCIYKRR